MLINHFFVEHYPIVLDSAPNFGGINFAFAAGGAPPASGGFGGSAPTPEKQITIRKEFPETFMWDELANDTK